MPTEEEKKEQEAADNKISWEETSDEITNSKKADDAEITDTSDSTQNKADTVNDDNAQAVGIKDSDSVNTKESGKTSEKDNHKKEYSTEIKKVSRKLKKGFEAAGMHVDIIV